MASITLQISDLGGGLGRPYLIWNFLCRSVSGFQLTEILLPLLSAGVNAVCHQAGPSGSLLEVVTWGLESYTELPESFVLSRSWEAV